MAQYGTIITNIGLAQIANAQITQTKVGLEYIALGDGNGAHYVPKQNQTALIHEVWRGPIAELSIDPTNSNRIIIDAVIPVTAGGFTIREIGIFDDKNNLIAVGQYPEKYKPQLSEGVSEETLIHFVIETNNADVVKLTIDPTVIIASRNYVDGKVAQVQTALTEHSGQIATTEKLGHIKPDGETITVDPVTGVAIATVANIDTKVYSGDLNNLTENGYYSVPANTPNAPGSTPWLVEVAVSADATYVVQTARHGGSNNLRENVFQRVAVKDGSGQFIWGTVTSGTSGYLGNWKIVSMNISDAIDSETPLTGASSKAVKQLNDSKANKIQETSFSPSLQNGWLASSTPKLYKDEFGVVHLTAEIHSGTTASGTTMLTLPVNYRPNNLSNIVFMGITYANNSGTSPVSAINFFVSNGELKTLYTAQKYVLIDISFRV